MWVYILQLSDGSYYTGITDNIERRMNEHKRGTGSRFVKGRRPFKLVYKEEHSDRGGAMRRERYIKKLSKEQKERLISSSRLSISLSEIAHPVLE